MRRNIHVSIRSTSQQNRHRSGGAPFRIIRRLLPTGRVGGERKMAKKVVDSVYCLLYFSSLFFVLVGVWCSAGESLKKKKKTERSNGIFLLFIFRFSSAHRRISTSNSIRIISARCTGWRNHFFFSLFFLNFFERLLLLYPERVPSARVNRYSVYIRGIEGFIRLPGRVWRIRHVIRILALPTG